MNRHNERAYHVPGAKIRTDSETVVLVKLLNWKHKEFFHLIRRNQSNFINCLNDVLNNKRIQSRTTCYLIITYLWTPLMWNSFFYFRLEILKIRGWLFCRKSFNLPQTSSGLDTDYASLARK